MHYNIQISVVCNGTVCGATMLGVHMEDVKSHASPRHIWRKAQVKYPMYAWVIHVQRLFSTCIHRPCTGSCPGVCSASTRITMHRKAAYLVQVQELKPQPELSESWFLPHPQLQDALDLRRKLRTGTTTYLSPQLQTFPHLQSAHMLTRVAFSKD